jgi:hypothetical protein
MAKNNHLVTFSKFPDTLYLVLPDFTMSLDQDSNIIIFESILTIFELISIF